MVLPETLAWLVLAPTSDWKDSFLSGTYIGISADASFGIGAGAKVLLGGSQETIVLQPIRLQAQTGFNLALGVTELKLAEK